MFNQTTPFSNPQNQSPPTIRRATLVPRAVNPQRVTEKRQAVRYGERQRPEHRSRGLLIDAQVADAPRTVPMVSPRRTYGGLYLALIWAGLWASLCLWPSAPPVQASASERGAAQSLQESSSLELNK